MYVFSDSEWCFDHVEFLYVGRQTQEYEGVGVCVHYLLPGVAVITPMLAVYLAN